MDLPFALLERFGADPIGLVTLWRPGAGRPPADDL
jgi:hypothetical protein